MKQASPQRLFFHLFFIIFLHQASWAADDHESSSSSQTLLLNEPSCFVNHSVNVITGSYHENDIDIEVAGPHPLYFQRSYNSGASGSCCCAKVGNFGHQWFKNHHGQVSEPYRTKESYDEPGRVIKRKFSWATVTGDCGTVLHYKGRYNTDKKKERIHKVNPEDLKKFITNCPDYSTVGSHVRNNRLSYICEYSNLALTTGNGFRRHYRQKGKRGSGYEMAYEVQPNGCAIYYDEHFSEDNDQTEHTISLRNPSRIELSRMTRDDDWNEIRGSDGRWVKYYYCTVTKPCGHKVNCLERVEGSDIPTQSYEYSVKKPKIIQKNLPDGRFLSTSYYNAKSNCVGNINVELSEDDVRIGRVALQKAPVGYDATPFITHRYFYDLRVEQEEVSPYESGEGAKYALGGRTTVYDIHDNKVEYDYDDDYRITDIRKWAEGNEKVYSLEKSYWCLNDTTNSTNLRSRTLENGNGEIKLCRSYLYDEHGNVIQDSIWGNITGKCDRLVALNPRGFPINGSCECYVKESTYTPNNPFKLKSEKDSKKTIEYKYKPHTNLMTERFVKEGDKIHKREFFDHDENRCLQTQIVDDGTEAYIHNLTSVTERRITSIINRNEAPIGLPQIVEKKCVDLETNSEILLGRVVNAHSAKGYLLSQEHYDSESVLRYTLEWDYDSMGNMSMEKDAVGRVIKKTYDNNRNLILEEWPHLGVRKEHTYDFVNRLVKTTEEHPDGVILIWSYKYDGLGNKTSMVDPYGNETLYKYDNQNRLIQKTLPQVLDENMAIVKPISNTEYDLLNNPTRLTDACGGETTISYTVLNKPFFKTYPDGTTEHFEYDLKGNLVESIAQNGTRTTYEYDPFDRLIKKEVYSAENELLQSESNVFGTFHLLSSTDAAGITTAYAYDKAGRVSKVSKGEMCTDYEYDSLGREYKVKTFFGLGVDQFTANVKDYDNLNRVVEERVEDSIGKCLTRETYEYDLLGNCNVIRRYNQSGESVSRTEYNTRGQPVLITDPVGAETRITYRYDYYDEELGQYLPYSESTAPDGVITVTIKDALHRTKTVYRKDPYGTLLQKRHLYHTQTGQLSRTVDEVIVDGKVQREVVNYFKYDSAGRLVETCESEATPEQKITKYTYNAHGQKESEIKPDGISILYGYDSMGRLKDYSSTDGTIHYVYEYDAYNNPKKVLDVVKGTETLRNYDDYNRLKEETLGNGLTVQYSYDLSGKPTQLTFPDGSGMGLAYDNLFLKEVSRIGHQGEKLYAHSYDAFDMSGNVLEGTLIGNAGKIGYKIDLKGRMTGITTDVWSENIGNFDVAGNVSAKTSKDQLGNYASEFGYDKLNQLIEEKGAYPRDYACDSLYNRIRKGKFDYAINNINQITHDGENTYEYDLNGNLILIQSDEGVQKFGYDALNRLISVEKGDLLVTYIYDEMNRRICKSVSSGNATESYRYFYQGQNEIGCFKGETLVELRLLGIGKGAEIGAAVSLEIDGGIYAPIHDLHGNVVCLVEAESGKVKEFYRYTAFGEEYLFDHQDNPVKNVINPWRFSSKRTDSETGFVNFGRRYYHSGLGRWITQDPIGFDDGPNLYAYVMNNPLLNIDLYGLSTVEQAGDSGGERGFFSSVRDMATSVYEGIRDTISTIGNCVSEALSSLTSSLSEGFSFYREERQVKFNSKIYASMMNRAMACSYVIAFGGRYTGIGYTNGICTGRADHLSNAEVISEMVGGGQITTTYNPTNSFFHDVCRAFHSLYFYLASNVVYELHKKWDEHFAKYPNMPWLEICHSEGAINVRNALMSYNPELAALIDVVGIAPACYIDKHLCRNVDHYVSTRDFVPLADIPGRIRNRDTVHVLRAHKDANFWDHDFQSPTYKKAISDHVRDHISQNGY